MKKLRKLPKVHKYRGRYRDYVVGVEEVSRETLEDIVGTDIDGFWDDHQNIPAESKLDGRILLANDLSLNIKWKTLWHELEHSWIDIRKREEDEDDG